MVPMKVLVGSQGSSSYLAIPKSVSLTSPFELISTLSGLISLCNCLDTTCMYDNPASILSVILAMIGSGTVVPFFLTLSRTDLRLPAFNMIHELQSHFDSSIFIKGSIEVDNKWTPIVVQRSNVVCKLMSFMSVKNIERLESHCSATTLMNCFVDVA